MSLKTEIYDLLVADSSINYWVGDNIYHNILPLNQDTSANSLVYMSRIATPTHTMNERDISEEYSVTIKIVGTSPVNNENINREVRRTMQAYSSANIADVMFERDIDVYDEDNDLYTESLDFTVYYYN